MRARELIDRIFESAQHDELMRLFRDPGLPGCVARNVALAYLELRGEALGVEEMPKAVAMGEHEEIEPVARRTVQGDLKSLENDEEEVFDFFSGKARWQLVSDIMSDLVSQTTIASAGLLCAHRWDDHAIVLILSVSGSTMLYVRHKRLKAKLRSKAEAKAKAKVVQANFGPWTGVPPGTPPKSPPALKITGHHKF